MRTMQITIAVPDDARAVTTEPNGCMLFWTGRPKAGQSVFGWMPSGQTCRFIFSVETGIPCPNWRDSLVELKPEGEDE